MKLHFRKLGEGKPLLILHGLFGSSDNWQTLAKYYAETFAVYLIDLRNHGHSDFSQEMNYNLMADDVYECITHESLSKVSIIGHSMGGKVALFFAQQHPELIDKLIIADMGLKSYPPHHNQLFEAMLALDLDVVSTRKEAETQLKKSITDQGVLQFLLKNLYWTEKDKLAWRFNLHVLHDSIESILQAVPSGKIEVETLFIRGGKSNYILENDYPSILNQVPKAKFETIKQAGHWLHAEAPQEFFKLTTEFLKS